MSLANKEINLAHKMISSELNLVKDNLKEIKHVIAIHSGKGGVGKTFFAVNLAFALSKLGRRVGLLDADIDCPNVPKFLGLAANIGYDPIGKLSPIPVAGISVVSMILPDACM